MKQNISSLQTKKLIAEALKSLLRTKPLERITISDISDTCGINRKTFYYHFRDVYDLIEWIFKEEAIRTIKDYTLHDDPKGALTFVLQFLSDNAQICRGLLQSMGRDHLRLLLHKDVAHLFYSFIRQHSQDLSVPKEYKEFLACYYADAIVSAILTWFENGMKESPERLIQFLVLTNEDSIQAALKRAEALL